MPNTLIAGSNNQIVAFYSAYCEMIDLPNEQYYSITVGLKRASLNNSLINIFIILETREDFNAYSRLRDTIDLNTKHLILICVNDETLQLATAPKITTFNHKEITLDFTSALTKMHICKPYLQAENKITSPETILEYVKFMLTKGQITLPIKSECALGVISALDNDDINFKTIDQMTKTDPALHSGIIKMSNSAYFAGNYNEVKDVEKALVRVGLANVKVFLINFINKSLAANKDLLFADEISKSIKRSLIVASYCHVMSKLFKVCSPVTLFSIGLLSLIGEIFMYAAISDQLSGDKLQGSSMEKYKKLAVNNGMMVGGMLLRKWKFPDEYCLPVLHSCSLGTNSFMSETKIIYMALNMLDFFETGALDEKVKKAMEQTGIKLDDSQLVTIRNEASEHLCMITSILS